MENGLSVYAWTLALKQKTECEETWDFIWVGFKGTEAFILRIITFFKISWKLIEWTLWNKIFSRNEIGTGIDVGVMNRGFLSVANFFSIEKNVNSKDVLLMSPWGGRALNLAWKRWLFVTYLTHVRSKSALL